MGGAWVPTQVCLLPELKPLALPYMAYEEMRHVLSAQNSMWHRVGAH